MGNYINKLQFMVRVPHNHAYLLEHLGRYHKKLEPGLNFLIPIIQQVAYRHSLKEQSFEIHTQNAVTKDNVIMQLDGVLYLKVNDPVQCSYGASEPIYYSQILAQSILRSEIGKLTLDQTFEERDTINKNILDNLKQATEQWGLQCLRYEIKDIKVSESIRKVMNLEAESERKKRAEILLSEGRKLSEINMAEARKQSSVLQAQGAAQEIWLNAQAVCQRINYISKVLENTKGQNAIKFELAQNFIDTFEGLSDQNKNIVIKSNLSDPTEILNQSLKFLQTDQKEVLESENK